MAATLLQEISQDEHEKARIRSRRMYEMDMYSNLHTSIEREVLKTDKKWQAIVADNEAKLADRDAKLADKDAEIERLRSQIAELKRK